MALLGKFSVKNFKSSLFASNNNAIVHNRFVLYFIFLISLGNLFYMSMDGDVFSIILFALIGYLTSFFSKNMTMEDGEEKDKKVKDTAETFEKMKQLADILGTK